MLCWNTSQSLVCLFVSMYVCVCACKCETSVRRFPAAHYTIIILVYFCWMESQFISTVAGPHPTLAIAGSPDTVHSEGECQLRNPREDLVGDGFLWGVPKHRRSRERRLIRKFGLETFHRKMLPIRKLLTCNECGHVHEPGRLCRKSLVTLFCGFETPAGSAHQVV